MSYREPPDVPTIDESGRTAPTRALPPAGSPDDIFTHFVRRANSEWAASVEALLSEPDPVPAEDGTDPDVSLPASDSGDRVVLLTTRKQRPPPAPEPAKPSRRRSSKRSLSVPADQTGVSSDEWSSVVPERSETTQRREAARLVPDVARVRPPSRPTPEGSEDGLMPSGELDRKLADMDVLLRYGHRAQVQSELEALRLAYPHDLLLLRRIAEFYVTHAMKAPALEALFALATGLFERRNIEGMRRALEQVRVLDPGNSRAARLLALLEQRPSSPSAR